MEEINRLHDIADDIGRTSWGYGLASALRDIADGIEREPRDLSGYESDVMAWVEKNGGLDAVKERTMPEGMEWPRFEDGEPVKFGDVVSDGDETGRVYYVTFDTVNPVIIGFTDETPDQDPGTWLEVSLNDGERVSRPAPQVLDADGAPIKVGDTVYDKDTGDRFEVDGFSYDGVVCTDIDACESDIEILPSQLTHRAPVLAADGKLLREGEHVYHVETGAELVVKRLPKPGEYQAVVVFATPASHLTSFDPDRLTHERPVLASDGEPLEVGQTVYHIADGKEYTVEELFEDGAMVTPDGITGGRCRADYLTHERPDSFSLIEQGAEMCPYDYAMKYGKPDGVSNGKFQRVDLVRRARALAEKEY